MKIKRYLYLQSLMNSFVVVLVVAAVASADFFDFFLNFFFLTTTGYGCNESVFRVGVMLYLLILFLCSLCIQFAYIYFLISMR